VGGSPRMVPQPRRQPPLLTPLCLTPTSSPAAALVPRRPGCYTSAGRWVHATGLPHTGSAVLPLRWVAAGPGFHRGGVAMPHDRRPFLRTAALLASLRCDWCGCKPLAFEALKSLDSEAVSLCLFCDACGYWYVWDGDATPPFHVRYRCCGLYPHLPPDGFCVPDSGLSVLARIRSARCWPGRYEPSHRIGG